MELRTMFAGVLLALVSIFPIRSYPFQRERGIENWVWATAAAIIIVLAGILAYYFLVFQGGTSTTSVYP